MNNLKNKCKYLEKNYQRPTLGCQKCKETLSILTYAKSTITYNLKKGATSFIYYFKKTRKN